MKVLKTLPPAMFLLLSSCASESFGRECDDLKVAVDSITTQTAILKSYLRKVDLENPKKDADISLHNNDFRLLGYWENGVQYPPLDLARDLPVICATGNRPIIGINDTLISDEHSLLEKSFKRYVKAYNARILKSNKTTDLLKKQNIVSSE